MISLNVEEKCQNCPYFSPNVEQIDATTLGEKKKLLQTVYCDHKDFCNNIEEYLENRK
jgi:hypothetical protein